MTAVDESEQWGLPDTAIGRAALQLMVDVSPTFIAHHNVRSYLFARELAAADGLRSDVDYDDELVFLSCILHDLGVTDYGTGDQRFEVDGADAAARFLQEHQIPQARISTVWQAIALHTSLGLAHKFGAEHAVTFRGISLDIDGAEKSMLSTGFADRVTAAWPRLNLGYAIAELIAEGVETNPDKGPPFTFPGHVHDLLYPGNPGVTFFDVVHNAGWNDQISPKPPTN